MRLPHAALRGIGVLLALLLACLVPAAPAAAQGTQGALPDPMTTRQIMVYADRLGLSAQQRLALESIHGDYKEQFHTLREGEIAAFLEEMRSLNTGGMLPERTKVERFLEKMERLQNKVRLLDDSVFDRLQPMLTEDQAAKLVRVRLLRERERFGGMQMVWSMGGRPVDLSDIFFELDLPPETIEVVDHLLADYERQLTTKLRKVVDASTRMWMDMYDVYEATGFGDLSQEEIMADPELMQQLTEAMEAAFAELNRKAAERIEDINALNGRTYRNIAEAMPEAPARRFRNAYYGQAYSEIDFLFHADDEWIERLLRREELDDAQREPISAARRQFDQDLDRLVAKGIRVIEEHRDKTSPMGLDYDEEAWTAYYEMINALQEEAYALSEQRAEAVGAIVGEELMSKMRFAAAEEYEAQFDSIEDAEETEERFWSGDQFLAPRISRRDVRRYADRLGLDENARTMLESIHMDYAEQVKGLEAIKALRKANEEMWQYDEATETVTPPSEKTIEAAGLLRREALAALRAADKAFFEDVALAVIDESMADALARLQRVRLRQTYCSGQDWYSYGGASSGSLDLAELADEQDLPAEAWQRLATVMKRYDEAAIDLFRARSEMQLKMYDAQLIWGAEYQRAMQDGESPESFVENYQQIIGTTQEELAEAGAAVAALNRRTIDEMVAALGGDAGRALRTAYDRRAYPNVYDDPISVEAQLTAALALENLTGEQRDQLHDLAAAHRPEYERLSREMIQISGDGGPDYANFDAKDWEQWQQRQQSMERLRFDRNELNYQAISRLKALLREDQILAIGGLPDPVSDEQESYYP